MKKRESCQLSISLRIWNADIHLGLRTQAGITAIKINRWIFESMGNEEREMWTQVKSISFSISFSKLKSDYAMQNISTGLFANIQFNARDYMFQSKNTLMGHIPMIPI